MPNDLGVSLGADVEGKGMMRELLFFCCSVVKAPGSAVLCTLVFSFSMLHLTCCGYINDCCLMWILQIIICVHVCKRGMTGVK